MECSHDKILVNELLGIYASAIRPRAQLAAAHALYLAVDRCRDMVHVTNNEHIIQVIFLFNKKKIYNLKYRSAIKRLIIFLLHIILIIKETDKFAHERKMFSEKFNKKLISFINKIINFLLIVCKQSQ